MNATIATTLHEAYQAAKATMATKERHEITSEVYDEALGVVPPIYGYAGSFWVGEAYTHTDDGGISLKCWYENRDGEELGPWRNRLSRYYCRLCVVRR